MKALQTFSTTASRAARFSFFAFVLAALTALTPAASLAQSTGGLGQALALSAALRQARLQAAPRAAAPAFAPGESPAGFTHAPNGRTIMDRNVMRPNLMRSGALRKVNATSTSNVVPIPGAVQTFDLNNPPPAFRPLVGYGSDAAVNNNPANPPLFLNSLVPTNLTPVWSQDETFIVFSSNRNLLGGLNHDASDGVGSRFHLWASAVNGGEAFQITTSTGRANGGEFFPALGFADNTLVFTSDAQSPGVQNLYSISFSFSVLVAANNTATNNISDNTPGTGFSSVTMRGLDAFNNPRTGFDQVQRPTLSPANNGLVVFSARSVTGTNKGHYHIYYLYLNPLSEGFDPNNSSLPAKLTDGPAEDTDPAYSKDGQFVAFASTATQLADSTNNAIGPDPNTSQVVTNTPDPNGLRSLFLLGGGGGIGVGSPGFGALPTTLAATGGRITTAGTDNFGPAWSSPTFNQYTNQPPGFEYLAFARASSRLAPHDIYYLQTVRNINAGGETARSNEAATTPETINTPLYQIDAGGFNFNALNITGPGTNGNGTGNYVPDTGYRLNNLGQNLILGFGGVVGLTGITQLNQTNDPGTPTGIYATARTDASTFLIPNLTPGATYQLRFHLADPTSTAAGQRVFNISVNGQNPFGPIDLVRQAQQANGTLLGLVQDGAGNPIAGATITVNGGNVATNPPTVTTTATTQTAAPPNGDNNPFNYTATLPSSAGTYTVTVTPPAGSGFMAQTQTVSVNSASFTRADFTLNAGAATLQGTVTDATTTAPVGLAPVIVTDPATNAVVATTTTNGAGFYTVAVPAGTYNVTVNPAASTGEATQTARNVAIAAGVTVTQNFTLASGAAVGSLVGTVTNAAGAALSGVVVTVQGAGYYATFRTGPTFTAPAAPNGDGLLANYDVILPGSATPGTAYTVTYTLPGTTPQTGQTDLIISGAALRRNFVVTSAGTAGPNTAVVLTATATASTQTQTITTAAGTMQTLNAGGIYVQLTDVTGLAIVEGIDVLANNNAMTSSGFGATNPASGTTGPTNLTAIGGDGLINLTFQPPAFAIPPVSFNIFRSPVTAASVTSVNQPGSGAGTEGSNPFATIPFNPTQNIVTYTDTAVTDGTEYFYQVTAVFQEQITPEGFQIKTTGGLVPNAVIRLNTDDNVGEVGQTSATGNTFDDVYPTWSPFLSIFSIAYSSNRTVTYNNPTTSFPQEVAASVGDGGTVAGIQDTSGFTGYSVGANYSGILESQVLNLDPPILLRFSPDEIVHVQSFLGNDPTDPVHGTPTKFGINPGQKVTFTVRLSDREAGIDNGDAPNLNHGLADGARPQVFLQIKDPTSKYQNLPKLEHKVFARDPFYNTQANLPANDVTSGSVNNDLSLDDQLIGGLRDDYPSYPISAAFQGQYVSQNFPGPRGAHAGFYTLNGNDPTPTTIFAGKSGGGTNPLLSTAPGANGVVPGTDPSLFLAWGSEYECQFVNPQFLNAASQNLTPGDAGVSDYATPFYLAGIDDSRAYSGAGKQRPTANSVDAQGQPHPAEWLQMDISPVQDNRGGVLYTVTWTTPISATDFYLDVIAFDKAVFPTFPPATSSYSGGEVNWRIYDNVGGFSTNASIGNNDILVVSDNALGQKFAATTFNGTQGNLNLVPKLYGAESYFTDVDINILPDSVYGGFPDRPGIAPHFEPFIHPFFKALLPFGVGPLWLNGLGVGSYDDQIVNDGGTVDGVPYVQSQKYSIWRILSRGPVTQSVLSAYLPTPQAQPEVHDTQSTVAGFQGVDIPAKTVLDAHRCVVWLSPYTGDLLTDPGALDDPGELSQTLSNGTTTAGRPATTTVLRNFVQGGGRLFLTGQDVGSALTLGGTTNNARGSFLSDVMNATILSTNSGTLQLAATANRITAFPEYDTVGGGFYPAVTGAITGADTIFGDASFNLSGTGGLPYLCRLELSGANFGDPNLQSDSSLSQRIDDTIPSAASLVGKPDELLPANGATVAMTYSNGSAAMVFHDDPYDSTKVPSLPDGGTGGRTVYAGFGLEGMSQDLFSPDAPNPEITPFVLNIFVPGAAPRNPRSNILHNIVCYLRTGSVNGTITQTSSTGAGAGQSVPGVTVYLIPATGVAPPTRPTFSAITDFQGHYNILGVEPGTYRVAAYKTGYQSVISNPDIFETVEGDSTITFSLTINPFPPGKIAGQVHDTVGNPIAGAVTTFLSKDQTVTVTGTTTTAPIAGLAAGDNYLIQNVPVTDYTGSAVGPNNPNGKPEYLPASAPDPPFATDVPVADNSNNNGNLTDGVNFTLTPILASISGRIYDASNPAGVTPVDQAANGLKNATVTLTQINPATGKPIVIGTPVKTAADGTYTIPNIPSSSTLTQYTITATDAGFGPTNDSITFSVYLGDILVNQDIGLTPLPRGSVSGRVTLTDGVTGVQGAIVTITSTDGVVILSSPPTAADGSYTIANVPPSNYTATAIAPPNPHGRPQSAPTPPLPPNTAGFVVTGNQVSTVSFALTPLAPSFSGVVSNAATGAPLVGATVTVTNDNTGAVIITKTVAGGAYSVTGLAPGTYTVMAALAGFAPASLTGSDPGNPSPFQIIVYYGDTLTNQNIVLTPLAPGTVSGIVTDPSGNPIANATVIFKSVDGTQTFTATTGAGGLYSLSSTTMNPNQVAAASYNGSAFGPNNNGKPEYTAASAPVTGNPIVVPSGGTVGPINFVLTPILPTVTGTVTDSTTGAAVPIPGATVTFTPTAGGTAVTVTTDAGGNYASGPLQPGAYSVTAAAAGHFPSTAVSLTLMLGDAVVQNFTLGEEATLAGLIRDATTSAVLSGVTITVTNAATGVVVATVPASVISTATTTTGPDGLLLNYELNVGPGTYKITASKPNYTSQTVGPITLTNAPFARQDFKLVSTIGSLGGLVTNSTDTTPLAGVTVTVTNATKNVVATFTTNGSTTTAPDGSPINYLGSLGAGTYTVTISQGTRTAVAKTITVLGGQFNRLDFTGSPGGLPPLYTFPAGLNFLSTPYDYSSVGFDALFGTLNTAPTGTAANGNRSHVAVWDPTQSVYALDPNPPADLLRLGVGYWVYLKNAVNLTQQGATPTQPFVAVTLHPFWNQIGVSNPSGTPVSSLMFDNGAGGKIPFAQAVGAQFHIVSPTLYRFDGVAYQPVVAGDTLEPYQAYWIKVFVDATLEEPTAAAGTTTTTTTGTTALP